MAWLSDDTESPTERFFHAKGRDVLVTGEVVADDWEDLTDGTLQSGIDRTLSGELRKSYPVWTATTPSGEAFADKNDCENWSSNSPDLFTRQGVARNVNETWTDDGWMTLCGTGGVLYCFEQE
jgi:hypothetical protein